MQGMAYEPVHHPEIKNAIPSVTERDTATSGAAGRNSFDFVDIHGVSDENSLSQSTNQRWTENSSFTVKKHSEKRPSRRESFARSPKLSKTGSWTFEIVSFLVGLAAVAAIIGVLARFDGRPLPEWPYDITLNALIALLATVANANMAIPLQSGISQLKWIRFKAGRAPLTDMEIFDEASRGTWGAIQLIIKGRGGFSGSFGAVVAIVALALGPFAQQIATYPTRMVQSDVGASIPRALNYSGFLPGDSSNGFVPILPMKAAVYNGLFAENQRPAASLKVTCATGNCTWNEFETLAVCTECVDVTAFMTRYCADGTPSNGNYSTCGWTTPQGARLNSSFDVFSMTSHIPSPYGDMPHSTIMKLTFMGTESQSGTAGQLAPWALQCTLQACVQTLSSAVVSGSVSENVTQTAFNKTVVDITQRSEGEFPVHISSASNNTYMLAEGAMLGMRSWFGNLFANGSATRNASYVNQTITQDSVIVNLTVGISSGETFFDTDIVTAFYWNYYEYSDGLRMLMNDLATSMTVAFRSFNGAVPVSGIALRVESFVHVRWGFVTVPVLVPVLTALFLAAAIFRSRSSRTKLWKSSALAMLFHGLDPETRASFGRVGSLDEKRRQAKEVKVQLDESDNGSLLRE